MAEGMNDDDGWTPGRWYRVLDTNGKIWCETSDKEEAKRSMEVGHTLWRIWNRTEMEWRKVD